jgi:hypothetical protein
MGSPRSAEQFRRAWESENPTEIGRLLGYPACCCEFYDKYFVKLGFGDHIWHTATNTLSSAGQYCELENEALTNTLLHRLGIKPVLHFPCSFDCQGTIQLARSFMQLGRAVHLKIKVDCLIQALSWPVQWTALHGIAEIKTPIFKAITDTDATAEKYTVRLASIAKI